jgi:hypothetical protein
MTTAADAIVPDDKHEDGMWTARNERVLFARWQMIAFRDDKMMSAGAYTFRAVKNGHDHQSSVSLFVKRRKDQMKQMNETRQ